MKFIAYHKIFEYLAAGFGFEIAGYVEPKPGIPPSAGYIEGLMESIKRTKPAAILCTANYGLNESRSFAAKTGLKVVVLPQDVGAQGEPGDWFTFMDLVISSLEKGG